MIERLQRRMTLLVIAVIVLISAGIVASINLVNYEGMCRQARQTLSGMLEEETQENSLPSESTGKMWQRGQDKHQNRGKGQPFSIGKDAEQLSNTYRIRLDSEGKITWQSSRADLYTDEQIQELAEEIQASGKTWGRIGTQFFRAEQNDSGEKVIAVLDARLEISSLQRVLFITIAVALAAGLLLGAGAFLLIRRMIRPVREAFEQQRRFISDASHEMKTPLAIISANAQVLEGEIGENESLGIIRSEVDRTAKLVRSLLTLAHSDRQEKKVLVPVDLSQETEGAVLTFESVAFEAGRSVEQEIGSDVRIMGDASEFRQILNILMDNALKYGDAGTPIRVGLKKVRREAVLTVENAAENIPKEELPKLFERFYRGDAAHSRTTDGSGLGLSIAKGLAEGMGGQIRAESEEHLVRFSVCFPLCPDHAK